MNRMVRTARAAVMMMAFALPAAANEPGVLDSEKDRRQMLGNGESRAAEDSVDVQEAVRPAPPEPLQPDAIQGRSVYTEDGREVAVVDGSYHGDQGGMMVVLRLSGAQDEFIVVPAEQISRARGGERLILHVSDQATAGR